MSSPLPRSICMIGTGAIGAYYGARLAWSGNSVTFLARTDFEAIRENGIVVRDESGEKNLNPAAVENAADKIGPVDLVLIGIKATASANAALQDLVSPLLHENTDILTLQNGLGQEELLADWFGADRIYGGLCFVCINRLSPGVVEHYGYGHLSLGKFSPGGSNDRSKQYRELFANAGIESSAVADLREARWKKLMWNIPFNGLTIAAGGCGVDRIVGDPALCAAAKSLMQELAGTAELLGIELPPDLPDKLIADTRSMGDYKPSTLLDWLSGRELELEAIFHRPLAAAKKAGADTPRLEQLCALLQQLAHSTSKK